MFLCWNPPSRRKSCSFSNCLTVPLLESTLQGQNNNLLTCLNVPLLEFTLRGQKATLLNVPLLESTLRGQKLHLFDLFECPPAGIHPSVPRPSAPRPSVGLGRAGKRKKAIIKKVSLRRLVGREESVKKVRLRREYIFLRKSGSCLI